MFVKFCPLKTVLGDYGKVEAGADEKSADTEKRGSTENPTDSPKE